MKSNTNKPPTVKQMLKTRDNLAKGIYGYIKARAAVEGMGFELDVAFFQNALDECLRRNLSMCRCDEDAMYAGRMMLFGVKVDLRTGELFSDEQEPSPGFFDSYFKDR